MAPVTGPRNVRRFSEFLGSPLIAFGYCGTGSAFYLNSDAVVLKRVRPTNGGFPQVARPHAKIEASPDA